MFIRDSVFIMTILAALSLNQAVIGAEIPNPAKDPPGQRLAPDGSQVDKTQSGPLAVPFGGTSEKVETAITGTVIAVNKKSIRIKDAKGKVKDFKMAEQTVTTSPQGGSGVIIKKDDNVSALYDEKTMVMSKIQIIQ